jgi:transposase
MRRNLFWLSDEQWAQIEPHLPTDVRGKKRVDDRRVSIRIQP